MTDDALGAPEELLEGSNFNRVVRVGDTVRRSKTGPWTPAIHALLRHLERLGFDGAPRAIGLDERGREILTYVPGEMVRDTLPPADDGARWDALLTDAGRLLRRFHDAAQGFVAPDGSEWQHSWFGRETARGIVGKVASVVAGEVVCHNDIGPGNTVTEAGVPAAFIDWDFAHPAPRAWGVAYGMANFAQLPSSERSLSTQDRGRRMRVFCEGYRLTERAGRRGLLGVIEVQLLSSVHEFETKAAAGDEFCVAKWAKTDGAWATREDITYLRQYRSALSAAFGAD